jgi:hypothetical protein
LLVPHPADVPPQDRVLMPEHQQFGFLRQVAAEGAGQPLNRIFKRYTIILVS